MKYMTPDLIAGFRSEDEAVAEAAAEEWDRRSLEYKARLKEIRPWLLPSVRRLLRYPLHDAKVLTMAADEVPHFSIFLELNNPADPRDKHLGLRYRLVGGPLRGRTVEKHDILAGDGKPCAWWLYDEIDMLCGGPAPAMTHSILLTGGYEFQLTFFTLSCRRLDFTYGSAGQSTYC